MNDKHPDLDVLCRPIECSILDDEVDEFLDAEIDAMSGIGESAGIDAMLDAEIDSLCESGDTTFEDLVRISESCDCDCEDDDEDDEEDEDEEDDDEEECEYEPSDDDYTNYSEVEFKEEDNSDD